MTKAQFVGAVAERNRLTKKAAAKLLDQVVELVVASAKRGRFHWHGFGVFSVRRRKGRRIRNPQTRGLMRLPPSRTLGFKCAREVRERM